MSADAWLLMSLFAVCGVGVVAVVMVPERRVPLLLAIVGTLAALAGLAVSADVLRCGTVLEDRLWRIPPLGTLSVSLDRLSALFLLVSAIVVLASSMFSLSYLERYLGRYSLKNFAVWYLALFASIVLILIAVDVLLFLLAWELMSMTSYLLVSFENEHDESSRAGFLMLSMGEAGFLAVVVALLFLGASAGSLEFSALKAASPTLGATARWIVFLLTFFGFGVKAGLVPVNTWLPRAHPAAPANVSAILSGVILNLGLYGIVRVNLDLVPIYAVGAGVLVLVVGTISALIGILYATTENDLKAMLAHSSIENIGIVTTGIGAGLVFMAYGRPVLAGIAFIAAFYHMVNHSAYKALLFLGAGTVDDRAGTRDLNRLGGLIRAMPWTAGAVLVGTLAIAALPPLNGFVSEWLTLQALLRSAELPSITIKIVFALCGAGLALTAALALTCFVKMFAMGFLGMPRSEGAASAVEARASCIVPMGFLAVLCLLLGVLPTYVIPALSRQLQPWAADGSDALVPAFFVSAPAHPSLPPAFAAEFHDLGAQVGQHLVPGRGLVVLHRGGADNPVVFAMSTAYMLAVLMGLLVVTYLVVRLWLTRARQQARRERWDGGVRRLLPEMTYTATGFSNPVRVIFEAVFRPTTVEDTSETVAEHFRTAIRRERETVHVVDRLIVRPVRHWARKGARALAAMHHGYLNAYLAYVLLALLLALAAGLGEFVRTR
ncbi:MAG TPA: proton-conducting transporter membrane subunit [Steroidobacteraceae bacterium]|nr:proton-conducting transporter membrane subunit [Steroidobacteraceae bacterium]